MEDSEQKYEELRMRYLNLEEEALAANRKLDDLENLKMEMAMKQERDQ